MGIYLCVVVCNVEVPQLVHTASRQTGVRSAQMTRQRLALPFLQSAQYVHASENDSPNTVTSQRRTSRHHIIANELQRQTGMRAVLRTCGPCWTRSLAASRARCASSGTSSSDT